MNAETLDLAQPARQHGAERATSSQQATRLAAVDAVRGLIMLLMAIDHVGFLVVRRHSVEFWGGQWTRYGGGDQVQFVLRLLSDLCAPGFFLWMGVGIALFAAQRTREGWSTAAITRFLALRGLLLIAIGQVIETPAWLLGLISSAVHTSASVPIPGGGGPMYAALGVIFALGASMVQAIGRMFRTDGLQLGYRYDASPICIDDGSPPPADDAETYRPSARPGARAPHAWLDDGFSTLDLFGIGFKLLRFGADDGAARRLIEAGHAHNVQCGVVDVGDRDIAALYERALVLVRPDGHVCWRGDALDIDPLALLDHVRGV